SGPDVIGAAFAERGGSEIDRGLPLVPALGLGLGIGLLDRCLLLRSGLLDRLIGGELVRLVVRLGSGLLRGGLLRGSLLRLLRRSGGHGGRDRPSGGTGPEERFEDRTVRAGQRDLKIESDR